MIPVTLKALVARIRRKLAHDYKMLMRSRGAGWNGHDLGGWYVVDRVRNVVTTHVDPVALGRELGVLATREYVVGA